jgi:hypothetical protein
MILKRFYDISTGFRFQRSVWECSVHICSCPWLTLSQPGGNAHHITKGQLISKCPFGVFKKPTKFFPGFLP